MVNKSVLASAAVAIAVSASQVSAVTIQKNVPDIAFVSFPAHHAMVENAVVNAELRTPSDASDETPKPAVVVVHGSAGIDSRGDFYIKKLNEQGFITLEVDLWSSSDRGWFGPYSGRPRAVPETLPDVYGALKFLGDQKFVDTKHISILGFSWGGVASMLTATQEYNEKYAFDSGLTFAAHVAHYPICFGYNLIPGYEFKHLTDAPVLIQEGTLDDYDDDTSCGDLKSTLPVEFQNQVHVNLYEDAYHAFDRLQPEIVVTDPYSHQGAGGDVTMAPNAAQALAARKAAVLFLKHEYLDK